MSVNELTREPGTEEPTMSDDRSILRRGQVYPLADRLTLEECKRWGVRSTLFPSLGFHESNVMAIWTDEKRPPKKGEWYLSGAPIDAYRAGADLSTEFHIARLVRVEKRAVQVISELVEKGSE
jgi:hypothetical protein